MLTGLVGYLLFDSMGIWGGILTAGIFSAGLFLKQCVRSRHAEGRSGGKWMRIAYEFFDGIRTGRRREAQAMAQRGRLEALRVKAHFLAHTCCDTYGAQSCCLEIISQTEKEDSLFMEACDLYVSTVAGRSRRLVDSRLLIPVIPPQFGTRPVPATPNVIPFPLKVDRN